jgi:hypothetical protein
MKVASRKLLHALYATTTMNAHVWQAVRLITAGWADGLPQRCCFTVPTRWPILGPKVTAAQGPVTRLPVLNCLFFYIVQLLLLCEKETESSSS